MLQPKLLRPYSGRNSKYQVIKWTILIGGSSTEKGEHILFGCNVLCEACWLVLWLHFWKESLNIHLVQCLSHHRCMQGFLSFVQQLFWDVLGLFTRVLDQHNYSIITGFSFEPSSALFETSELLRAVHRHRAWAKWHAATQFRDFRFVWDGEQFDVNEALSLNLLSMSEWSIGGTSWNIDNPFWMPVAVFLSNQTVHRLLYTTSS